MTADKVLDRFQWSKLSHLQVGRYAEHIATMRFIEAGLEVYTTEVDDRGIDHLVRYAPGRCLEIQVKSVRGRNLTFVEKKHLGATPQECEERLRAGYCMAFFLFEDGKEPDFFLIPGYAWLTPNDLLKDNPVGDKSVGPYLQLEPTKKAQKILDQYRFSAPLLNEIIRQVSGVTFSSSGDWPAI